MPKITIDIPDHINKQLKKYAIDNGRSLTQFLPRYIMACLEQSIITFDENGDFVIKPTATAGYLHYPPGVRSAENPAAVTTEYGKHKKSVIG